MAFPPNVERWRTLARQIAPDIPEALILAVIEKESGGVTGIKSRLGIDDYGLMQTKPIHLPGWNKTHPGDPITRAQLTGHGIEDARAQIKLGAHYLRQCLNAVHGWNPARWSWTSDGRTIRGSLTADQVMFSDLCYAAGIGGARNFRAKARAAGYPDTIEGLEAFGPNWGGLRPRRRFTHARAVANLWQNDGGGSAASPSQLPTVDTTTEASRAKSSPGSLIGLILLFASLARRG